MNSTTPRLEVQTPHTVAAGKRPDRFRMFFAASILLVFGGLAGWYWLVKLPEIAREKQLVRARAEVSTNVTQVEVVHPGTGGIDRTCVQPGTIEPFEAADLYAKVSGFLAEQSVDIGSRVKAGQILAKISVPEHEKQVDRDAARVRHADAVVRQMQARIAAATADAKSAEAAVASARAQLKAKAAYRKFREKQLSRLKELNSQRAIEARVVDESEDQYEAALESENVAAEAIVAADQRLVSAKAKIDQSRADLDEARAEVTVAAADLERSSVLVAYSVIASPYEGVVTKRSFNRGDFIRSADVGGDRVPLFSVERTDRMRVVVQVPDRDVPFTDIGDPASVEIDALPGSTIKTTVSRVAESEDAATRTMRTEIDVPNPGGRLRRGMYGRVTLLLEKGMPAGMTIPSAALIGKTETKAAMVRLLKEGKIHIVPVRVGADNGILVEIVSGLNLTDLVVVRSAGPAEEGTPAETKETTPSH